MKSNYLLLLSSVLVFSVVTASQSFWLLDIGFRILPPNSFIPMDDFKSPRKMADYLKMLMSNHSAYLSYFSWRAEGWSRPWQIPGYR